MWNRNKETQPRIQSCVQGPGEDGAIPSFCTQRLWNNRELAGTEKNEQKQYRSQGGDHVSGSFTEGLPCIGMRYPYNNNRDALSETQCGFCSPEENSTCSDIVFLAAGEAWALSRLSAHLCSRGNKATTLTFKGFPVSPPHKRKRCVCGGGQPRKSHPVPQSFRFKKEPTVKEKLH